MLQSGVGAAVFNFISVVLRRPKRSYFTSVLLGVQELCVPRPAICRTDFNQNSGSDTVDKPLCRNTPLLPFPLCRPYSRIIHETLSNSCSRNPLFRY